MPLLLNRTIRLFLDSIGRRDEYEYYLKKFHSSETAAFAILCPSPNDFETVAPIFTFDLDTLLRLDLFPVTLLCGPQAAGMRKLLTAQDHPYEKLEWPGTERDWSDEAILDMLNFVRASKENRRNALLVMPHQTLLSALAALLPRMTRRVHFIRPAGPLRNQDGQPILFYYTARPGMPELDPEDRDIAGLAANLLQKHPNTHISVASSWNLLEELFTVKGAGCIIRRGSLIDHFNRATLPSPKRLMALLEESFARKLARPDSLETIDEFYIEREYQGAALLEQTSMGVYLSKFAVGIEARGGGLAQELWDELTANHAELFWRARLSNPINQWYEKHAEGHYKTSSWRVFWRGIRPEDVTPVIQYSLTRPEDFAPASPGPA